MIGPTMSARPCCFFPVGNTPPVDVLQSIPPNQDASVLLLGCGDFRNVLFSTWCRSKSDSGKYDFTCCDISTEIIARNILLYTILIDAPDGEDITRTWNIYYHFMLDTKSLRLLQTQAQKLAKLTTSTGEWRKGPYGKTLRFCDNATFDRVVKLWKWYALGASHGAAFEKQQERLKSTFGLAQKQFQEKMGGMYSPGALRSSGPCSQLFVKDVVGLLPDYWNSGVANNENIMVSEHKGRNPMFSTEQDDLVVDHSTEPLQSFHLATAYIPLARGSPLESAADQTSKATGPVQAAMTEFKAWCKSFRRVRDRLVLRFTASDALAFTQVLHHHRTQPEVAANFRYRDRWHYDPLVLDKQEYSAGNSGPMMFDVIDTSNLVDHYGLQSTLYMELLALRDESLEAYAKGLLGGDLPTVSMILGFEPTQYWTNTTGFSPLTEIEAEKAANREGTGQARFVVMWKGVDQKHLRFVASDLASFIYKLYVRLFEHESFAVQMSKTCHQPIRRPYPHYTRAGFALLLASIKHAQLVNFDSFIEQLCSLVMRDRALDMGSLHFQSFLLHLHEFRLLSQPLCIATLAPSPGLHSNPFQGWDEIPATLFLSVAVNHLSLEMFAIGGVPQDLGYPLFQISLRSLRTGRRHYFPDVQIGFGDIRAMGTKCAENYTVQVETDNESWQGCKPMLASALIPTNILLQNPLEAIEVAIELIPTVNAVLTARSQDGSDPFMWLRLHVSALDRDDVFITKDPPNLTTHMSPSIASNSAVAVQATDIAPGMCATFHALFDEKAMKVEKLNVHIDLSRTKGESLLQSKAKVTVKLLSPFTLELNIGSGAVAWHQKIELPVPLTDFGSKTRIARSSSFVEFISDITSPSLLTQKPDSLYLMSMKSGKPFLQNLGYIILENLPKVDVADQSRVEWMLLHLDWMYCKREADIVRKFPTFTTLTGDIRVNFKTILARTFVIFAGLMGKKQQNAFGLRLKGDQLPSMLFFIESIRLDLASLNITLDAAMLPSTTTLNRRLGLRRAEELLNQMANKGPCFDVDELSLSLWQHAAVAFAERCRDWEHLQGCEYAKHETSNLLSTNNEGAMVCSCGLGRFPECYTPDVPIWKDVAKYCTRVAISPFFHVPMVEGNLDIQQSKEWNMLRKRMSSMEHMEEGCWECTKQAPLNGKLLKCGGCGVAKYCSKECQKKDWKEGHHKHACKGMKKL